MSFGEVFGHTFPNRFEGSLIIPAFHLEDCALTNYIFTLVTEAIRLRPLTAVVLWDDVV